MATPKKSKPVEAEEVAVEAPKVEEAKPVNKQLAALVEIYKAKNPVKYAQKKHALEAQINNK